MRYVPAHVGVEQNEKVDKLAKEAATSATLVLHDPLPGAYKARLKRWQKAKLNHYLHKHVKESSFTNYPTRRLYTKPQIVNDTKDSYIENEKHTARHPLLNRARTGHTACRQHLKNIGIEDSNQCRHCQKEPETLEHQILTCPALSEPLCQSRRKFNNLPQRTTFNQALWKHPTTMTQILMDAWKKGVNM